MSALRGASLLRQSSCQDCHRMLLRTFHSTPFRPLYFTHHRRTLTLATNYSQTRQNLTTHCVRRGLVDEAANIKTEIVENGAEEAEQDTTEDLEIKTSPIPWYLQVHTPSHPMSNPLAERQRLPALPSEPPALLQPMLEYTSISLGLDDLRLFDLRDVDPPPALGAHLMVVIGTARSEKHLHVSADRFCRWLRTSYKLQPYADGLLGRGELKLKMKRKARRARIMSHVGAIESTTDDGIRSGWVCVNVGTVEDGRPMLQKPTEVENFVGFGSGVQGANIVVQMLVQQKREELELERMLEQTIGRHERRQQRLSTANDQIRASISGHTESITTDISRNIASLS